MHLCLLYIIQLMLALAGWTRYGLGGYVTEAKTISASGS